MTEIIEEQINEVLADIDFSKIKRAMEATDWIWTNLDRTPNEGELEDVARKVLNQVAYGERSFLSMGGFEASNNLGVLGLKFVLDKSSPLGIFTENNG